MDKNSNSFDEFRAFCDSIRKKTKWSKKVLALNLGIDPSYYSRLYHGRTDNMPVKILQRASSLDSSSINSSPEKMLVQPHLPLDPPQGSFEIAKLYAIQDRDRKENLELRERVAVLEERLRQSNADSEKKIRDLDNRLAYSIRTEIERAQSRLSRPQENERRVNE